MKLLLLLCLLCGLPPAATALFEWLRQAEPPPAAAPPPSAAAAPPAEDARFEVTTADEKFLSEGKQTDLSVLDGCHQRVVSRLKASCHDLTEEQLAKLGVELFNCQAEVEGRTVYPCTEEMSIRACTAAMDSDTWNAYHIVSNRARSVCYAARQQLFRRRAEHTVNTLISAAGSQLEAMKELKGGQLELRELTAASLDKLLQGHGALRSQQEKLHQDQELMEDSLRDNLRRLDQEKTLIASGQELVAQLVQGVAKRMENVSENLQIQNSEVQQNHQAIVQDLADVRHQAEDIYQKIDHSMAELLQYQDQTSQYYSDLMDKLERMNGTLAFLLLHLDGVQSRVEERLRSIQSYLGWAGLSLAAIWTCVAHGGYFVLCAVLLTFLRCPGFSRAALLLTVPLNAVAEVNQQPALDLAGLSLLILALSLAHWLASQLLACLRVRGPPPLQCKPVEALKSASSCHSYPACSTPLRGRRRSSFSEQDDSLNHDTFLSGATGRSVAPPSSRRPILVATPGCSTPRFLQPVLSAAVIDEIPSRNLCGAFDAVNDSRDLGNDSRSASPTRSVSNSSLWARQLCNGITKTGKACKKRAAAGHEYCRVHEGGQTSHLHS